MVISKLSKKYQFKRRSNVIHNKLVHNFHISQIATITSFDQFRGCLERKSIDESFVMEVIQILSCCQFSTAAEHRFVSYKEIQNIKSSKIMNNNGKLKLYSEEIKLQTWPRFIFSKFRHLQAIQVLYYQIDIGESLQMDHLISSYTKNYQFNFFMIEEELEHAKPPKNVTQEIIDLNHQFEKQLK